MIYFTTTSKKISVTTRHSNSNNLIYLKDFLFFIYILKNYVKYNTKNIIYFLNLFIVKYIIYLNYLSYFKFDYISASSFYYLLFYNYFSRHIEDSIKYNNIKKIKQKIVLIKKISRTRKKGRVRRYKILLFIGNKSGWIGFGSSKDYYLQDAILKARKKAFNNIYYIPMCFFNSFKTTKVVLDKKHKKLYIDLNNKNKIKVPRSFIIRSFFECLGLYNITSKKIGTLNVYNTLKFILQSFKL